MGLKRCVWCRGWKMLREFYARKDERPRKKGPVVVAYESPHCIECNSEVVAWHRYRAWERQGKLDKYIADLESRLRIARKAKSAVAEERKSEPQ